MRHAKARFLLEAFDTADLTPAVSERLQNHVHNCLECSETDRESTTFLGLMASVRKSAEPAGFEAALHRVRVRTLSQARAEAAVPVRFSEWLRGLALRPATAILASAALLAAVFLIQPINRESSLPSASNQDEGPVLRAAVPHQDFMIVRNGSSVQIEWARTNNSHQVRKAARPEAARTADRRVVHEKVWKDAADTPAPGQVIYYLVD